jgi:hypothetical protein
MRTINQSIKENVPRVGWLENGMRSHDANKPNTNQTKQQKKMPG